jgi:hypothetical protein
LLSGLWFGFKNDVMLSQKAANKHKANKDKIGNE